MGEMVTCETCGDSFEVLPYKLEKNDHHFCNRECYHEWKRNDWVPPWTVEDKPTMDCVHCGETFEIYPFQEGKRKFCSRECSDEYKKTLRGPETANYQGGKVVAICEECSQPFGYYERKGEDNPIYCSRECYDATKSERMKGQNNPVWRGGWHHYYGANWDEQRAKALERDNHTCQRCGKHTSEQERSLDVHHKKRIGWFREEYDAPEWWEKGNELNNLVTMCPSCHKTIEWENGV